MHTYMVLVFETIIRLRVDGFRQTGCSVMTPTKTKSPQSGVGILTRIYTVLRPCKPYHFDSFKLVSSQKREENKF